MTGVGVDFGNLLSFGGTTVLVLLFCAHFLVLEAIFLSYGRRSASRSQLKRRLVTETDAHEQVVALTRKRQKRGLSGNGGHLLSLAWLNRLITQSGVTWGVAGFRAVFMGVSTAVSLLVLFLIKDLAIAVTAGLLLGGGLVLSFLRFTRDSRHRKLQAQLPEATDVLVRSLKAGHPVTSAIRLVARDIPDPLGTEFGIVADEMTYGLDLETAMNNLESRTGQQDIALIVIATNIQASTGGNLGEILSGMSKVVRERSKIRMKVKALSAEGRWSAIILSILPFALFGILAVIAPSYYGEIWSEQMVQIILVASAGWLMIGNVIMFRMTRFEI